LEPEARLPDNQAVKVSVIVPAFNEERLLAVALGSIIEALKEFSQMGWSSEVIRLRQQLYRPHRRNRANGGCESCVRARQSNWPRTQYRRRARQR